MRQILIRIQALSKALAAFRRQLFKSTEPRPAKSCQQFTPDEQRTFPEKIIQIVDSHLRDSATSSCKRRQQKAG